MFFTDSFLCARGTRRQSSTALPCRRRSFAACPNRRRVWACPHFFLVATRLRARALLKAARKPSRKGGGAPKGANCTGRTSGCGARHAARCCHLTALRARAPSGAPPRTRFGELTPPLSSSRASWDSASSGVTRIFPYPSPASSSQAGHYYRPGGVRSRPGAGVWPARGHRTRSASESTLAKASLMSELVAM